MILPSEANSTSWKSNLDSDKNCFLSLYLLEKCPKTNFFTSASFAILAACLAVLCFVLLARFSCKSKKVAS